ncbi:hypothetical protein KUL42_22340 [Alteromonas sp. KUL42]|nr:hypothetical protein KUL42_22340 [Alteromonas sp. KUL42]
MAIPTSSLTREISLSTFKQIRLLGSNPPLAITLKEGKKVSKIKSDTVSNALDRFMLALDKSSSFLYLIA